MKAIVLRQEGQHNSRAEYRQLLSGFPTSTVKKLPRGQLDTLAGRAHAITHLVKKHSGEVVELDPRTQEWRLLNISAVPGPARTVSHHQVLCMPDGCTRSQSQDKSLSAYDCGYSANRDHLHNQYQQIRAQLGHPDLKFDMLLPNWKGQWNRLQVPCAKSDKYMWFRTGDVITLGELFLVLGRVHTAASIYAFYRTLRIVVLKRCKEHSHEPGSASAYTGLTNGPLQASTMKRSLCSDRTTKQYTIKDCIEAKGRNTRTYTGRVLDAAVRHMHKILLCDLNPPGWSTNSPRLCQGIAC